MNQSPVLRLVERLQLSQLQKLGIDEAQWLSLNKARVDWYLRNSDMTIQDFESSIGIPIPLTPWQDSATQIELELMFRKHLSLQNFFPLDVQNGDRSRPYLVSALSSNLQTHTLVTSNNECAIILDNTLLCLAEVISKIVASLLYIRPQKKELSHPNYMISRILDHGDLLDLVYRIITETIDKGIANHDRLMEKVSPYINKNHVASREIQNGFVSFVLGHEYYHLGLQHHDIQNAHPSGLGDRKEEIAEIRIKYEQNYKKLFEFPNEDYIQKYFVKEQPKELQADQISFAPFFRRLCVEFEQNNSEGKFISACNLTGASLAIFLMDIFESCVRLLKYGRDVAITDLWFYESTIADLCFGKKYPSASSRWGNLYMGKAYQIAGNHTHRHALAKHFYDFFAFWRLHFLRWAQAFDNSEQQLGVHPVWQHIAENQQINGPKVKFNRRNQQYPNLYI